MNALGDLFTAFLFEYPFLWPLYALGLWHFIIRPMLDGQEDPGSESDGPLHPSESDNTSATIAAIAEDFPAGSMPGLLARTYNEHLLGEIEVFDGSIKDEAGKASFERFSKHFEKNGKYFDRYLEKHSIGEDEFIGAYWLDTKYRFILTNKCLFLPDEEFLISLESIRSVKVKGTISQTLRIKTTSAEELVFKVRGLRSDIFNYLLEVSSSKSENRPQDGDTHQF